MVNALRSRLHAAPVKHHDGFKSSLLAKRAFSSSSFPGMDSSAPPRHLTDDLDSDAAPLSPLTLTFMHGDTHYDRENMFY